MTVLERITPADIADTERTLVGCGVCSVVEYAAFMVAHGDDWLCPWCDATHRAEHADQLRDIARWQSQING